MYAESEDQKVPQKVKGRNATMRTGKIEQHIHEHLRKHLKHIGAEVDSFLEEQPIAGVLIGSHQQLIKPLEDHLPNKLKGKILGEFIADLNAPFHKIIEKSQQELLSHHLFQPHPSLMLAK